MERHELCSDVGVDFLQESFEVRGAELRLEEVELQEDRPLQLDAAHRVALVVHLHASILLGRLLLVLRFAQFKRQQPETERFIIFSCVKLTTSSYVLLFSADQRAVSRLIVCSDHDVMQSFHTHIDNCYNKSGFDSC